MRSSEAWGSALGSRTLPPPWLSELLEDASAPRVHVPEKIKLAVKYVDWVAVACEVLFIFKHSLFLILSHENDWRSEGKFWSSQKYQRS